MKKVSLIIASLALLATPLTVLAAAGTPYTIENIGGSLGLGTADLKTTVINIIQWVLGILALVAVVMIIIGGFQWMTAAGNEERIEKAKKVISAAVIGLIIVLLAWAIVIFVAGTFTNVAK
jgi:amino acid transporter